VARLVELGTTNRLSQGFSYFLTLSAPGEKEHRKWVQGKPGPDRPSCDCHRVWEHVQRGDWNRWESRHWNRLRTSLSRRFEGMTYIGSVEVQKRGMLHRHLVINTPQPLEAAEVGDLALRAGYGCVHDLQVINSASKAAFYISKYVTKSAGDRENVPWRADVLDEETGEICRMDTTPTFRTWSAARSWGYTLKGLREIARAQAISRAEKLKQLLPLMGPPSDAFTPADLLASPT